MNMFNHCDFDSSLLEYPTDLVVSTARSKLEKLEAIYPEQKKQDDDYDAAKKSAQDKERAEEELRDKKYLEWEEKYKWTVFAPRNPYKSILPISEMMLKDYDASMRKMRESLYDQYRPKTSYFTLQKIGELKTIITLCEKAVSVKLSEKWAAVVFVDTL